MHKFTALAKAVAKLLVQRHAAYCLAPTCGVNRRGIAQLVELEGAKEHGVKAQNRHALIRDTAAVATYVALHHRERVFN